MNIRTKIVLTLAILAVVAFLLACHSTACMSNENLLGWLRGVATPQPCPWLP